MLTLIACEKNDDSTSLETASKTPNQTAAAITSEYSTRSLIEASKKPHTLSLRKTS